MALSFNTKFDPRYGHAIEVAPGVRRITAANAGPFTFAGTNTYLVGEATVAVIDPGPDDPQHLNALLQAIGTSRVSHILVTHTHRDHSPAARALQARTGAPIVGAAPHRQARPLSAGEINLLDASADHDHRPDRELADGERIGGDDWRIAAVTTPGHTDNHLAFSLEGADLLFSGDHVMGWATTIVAPPDGAMGAYMGSLDKLARRGERTYLPAHGGRIRDPAAWLRALKTHRRMRERAILHRLGKGDRTIVDIVSKVYRTTDTRLHGAAALSTLAHLEELVARRLVTTNGDAALDGAYELASSASAG